MKTSTKVLSVFMLAITATILIGGSFGAAALAAKKADQTINNAKQLIVKTSTETLTINVISQKGDKGDPGKNGTNGTNGSNGVSIVGKPGTNGTNGKDGVTTIVVCTGNNATDNPACHNAPAPVPVPVPVTNGTGNVTNTNTTNLGHAHHK